MELDGAVSGPNPVFQDLKLLAGQADDELDLLDCALHLSRLTDDRLTDQQADFGPYHRFQDKLTAELASYAGVRASDPPPALDVQWEALVQVMFKRLGFGGGERVFEDLDAANIRTVIDRREGLPVALGVLAIDAFRRLRWTMTGIDFPGRFLVRIENGPDRRLLDLFIGAKEMTPPELRMLIKSVAGRDAELAPEHFQVMSPRRVLLRLQENIRIRQIQAGDLADARATVETMLILAPTAAYLWREAGMLSAKLDHIADAINALEAFLALGSRAGAGGEAAYEASLILQELRQRLN